MADSKMKDFSVNWIVQGRSPTYMGGVSAQFKAFADGASYRWFQQAWRNKIAGGLPSGDKQGTLLYLAINAAQRGMIWVGIGEVPNMKRALIVWVHFWA